MGIILSIMKKEWLVSLVLPGLFRDPQVIKQRKTVFQRNGEYLVK